jgi:GT2 family glycosyltransferase
VSSCIDEINLNQLTAEIIVIDNASADGYPRDLIALSPMIRIMRNEENLGFGAANNRGILRSRGRYVLILNDDAILQKGSLGAMVSSLEADPRIGALGPTLLNSDGSPQILGMNKRLPHLRGVVCELLGLDQRFRRHRWARDWLTLWDDPSKSAEPDQVAGACLLARREALDQVGIFDEGFYYGLEDADLCHRLRRAGWRIVHVPDAQVTHHGSMTHGKWTRLDQQANYLNSVAYYFEKHSTPVKCFLVRLTLGFAVCIQLCIGVLRRVTHRSLSRNDVTGKMRANFKLLQSILKGDPTYGGPEGANVGTPRRQDHY